MSLHSQSFSSSSELWLLRVVLRVLDVVGTETECCGDVLHAWNLDSIDSSLALIELMKDAPDVDGVMSASEVDAVEGCWVPETQDEQDVGFN